MNRLIALLGSVTALALSAAPAGAATTVPVGSTGNPYFLITGQTLTDDLVIANFGATISGKNTHFDDIFTFYLPLSGVGSGSVSTSSSSGSTKLTITSVIINGIIQSVPGSAFPGVSSVPITAFAPNTIEIIGVTGANTKFGTFTGTATFTAVPEPATWATFLLGFGFLGLGLRRRTAKTRAIA